MSKELKLCPFCGSNGHQTKNLKGRVSYSCENGMCPSYRVDMCLDEWQSRPLETALEAENKRLREALEKCEFGDSCGIDGPGRCPVCYGRSSHRDGCEVQSALNGGKKNE